MSRFSRLFVRVSDRKGNVDVPPDQAALAEQIFHAGKPVITVGFGSPYLIENFPQAETWLAAFGISDVAQISVARALFGQIPIRRQTARDNSRNKTCGWLRHCSGL